ncbi:MAG TPA: IPT/TIG domain-containing protein [Blastocatellia bacterium]|nr:IPT/TIG domain-containing protein [Blastocatellia bacterium]
MNPVTINVQNAALPVTIGVPFPQSANLLSTAALRVKNPSGTIIAGSSAFEVLSRWGGLKTDATKPIMIALVSFKPSTGVTGNYTVDDSNGAFTPAPIQITDGANDIRVQNGALDVRVTKNNQDLLSQFIIGSTEQLAAGSKPRLNAVASASATRTTTVSDAGTNTITVNSTIGLAVGTQIRLKWEGPLLYIQGGAVVASGDYGFYSNSLTPKRTFWINRGGASQESLTADFVYPGSGVAEWYYVSAPAQSHAAGELVEDKTLLDDFQANGAYTISAINGNTLTLNRNLGVRVIEQTMLEVQGAPQGPVTAPLLPTETVVERQTENYVVVRQRGRFSSNVNPSVEVTVRWHFYQGMPWVRAQVRLRNYSPNTAAVANNASFDELRMDVPTAAAASGSDAVSDNATAINRVNAGTSTVTLSAGSFQMAVPEFAEKWPKGISGDAGGFHFGVFPASTSQTLPADRATSVEFYLGNSVATPATLTSRPTNCALDPAYVVATSAHRAVTTVAQTWTAAQFGGDAEMAEAANRNEDALAVIYDVSKAVAYGSRPAMSAKEMRNYGEYGDGYGWSVFGTFPWQDNPRCYNHYDTQFHTMVQFLRTGDLRALQIGSECARYMADYGMIQSRIFNGGNPYNQLQGLSWFEDEDRRGPGFLSHSWQEGLWLYWAVTGDQAVLDSALLTIEGRDENGATQPGCLTAADWYPAGSGQYPGSYYGHGASFNIWTGNDGSRWTGWPVLGLMAAYRYLGRSDLLSLAGQYASCFTQTEAVQGNHGYFIQDSSFVTASSADPPGNVPSFIQYGYTLIGMIEYWKLTGDAGVRDYISRVGQMILRGDAQAASARKDNPMSGGQNFAGQYLTIEGNYFWWPLAQTTLSANVAAGDTTITLTDASKFPFWGSLAIDDGTNIEYCVINSRSGNSISVVRGKFGSTARAWNSGAAVRVTAWDGDGPSVGRAVDYLPCISTAAKVTGDSGLQNLARRVFKDTAFYFGQGGPLMASTVRFPINLRTDGFPGSSIKNWGQRAFGFEQYLADVVANPVPVITTISPATKTAGDPAFTLTVNGSDFITGSVVRINGQDRTTTFVSATQVTAQIPSSDVAAAGTLQVTVFNPGPGGGLSNSVNLTVQSSGQQAPAPAITSLSPNSATAGGVQFTLTINGTDFQSGAVVRWNGQNRTTTFVSATQLTAAIPASDIASAGTATVTVLNPDSQTSNGAGFTINAAQSGNPAPVMQSISPSAVTAGASQFVLTVTGSNFINGSVVRWNGADLTTTFVSATQLTATVPASLVASQGNAAVTVFTPAPGGGTSQAATFIINAVFTGGSSTPSGPAITSISPELTPAGSAQFTLTVNGVRFSSNSVVKWNGADLATSFVSATQLTATVPASLVASQGNAAVVVHTPGGNNQGTSQQATFRTVASAGTITSLSPNTIAHGGPAFTLTINGSGFSQNTKVVFDGSEKPTSFVSATQLRAQISAADIATARTVSVKVRT